VPSFKPWPHSLGRELRYLLNKYALFISIFKHIPGTVVLETLIVSHLAKNFSVYGTGKCMIVFINSATEHFPLRSEINFTLSHSLYWSFEISILSVRNSNNCVIHNL